MEQNVYNFAIECVRKIIDDAIGDLKYMELCSCKINPMRIQEIFQEKYPYLEGVLPYEEFEKLVNERMKIQKSH